MIAESSWIFALPAGVFCLAISLTVSLVLCVCGRRIKEPKNELVGIEGRVKITNPEEYVGEVNANNIPTEIASDKVQSTAKRSLPDLPVDSQGSARGDVTWEPNGDATSELYATVGLQDEKNKKHDRQKSDSDSMSPSMTYTKVKKDHPYDKLKKVEHPYALVKEHKSDEKASSVDRRSNDEKETDAERFEMDAPNSSRPGIESSSNIPAATAISGNVTANDDLPYMTPPAHFSGDSQDSGSRDSRLSRTAASRYVDQFTGLVKIAEGYTSISVREPLSAIRGESVATAAAAAAAAATDAAVVAPHPRRADPHYATVFDDSDEMYAAIDDPTQAYASESETYAQIRSGSNRPKSAPQPPSVDSLKQMTISSHSTHTRQDSSSSLASSTAISSPKPEKRPANSPLPPTPTACRDSTDESCHVVADSRRSGSPRNVEDMYAKVNKKTRREMVRLERDGSTESGVSESSDSLSFRLQASTTESSRSCHSHLSKSTLADTEADADADATATATSSNGRIPVDSSSLSETETDPRGGYENLEGASFEFDRKSDPGYETLNRRPSSESDPEYEKLKPQRSGSRDPGGCGNVDDKSESDGYASVKPEMEIYSKVDGAGSESGYARLTETGSGDDGYAKVSRQRKNSDDLGEPEPNYEKVFFPSRTDADGGRKGSLRGGEPTYESLTKDELDEDEENEDPDYESVRFAESNASAEM